MSDSQRILDAIRRLVRLLRLSDRAARNQLGLSSAQLFVLHEVAKTPELSLKELADRTRTDQSTVSVVVGRVVERGLVKRTRSAVDTRRVELSLTARGRAVLLKTPTTVAQRKLDDALRQLSPADGATLSRILARVVELMGEADAPAPMLFAEPGGEKKRQR